MSDHDRTPSRYAAMASDAVLRDALRRISVFSQDTIPAAVGASVTLIPDSQPITLGSSNELASALDARQYEAGDGPCLTAATAKQTITVETHTDERWPSFQRECVRRGVSGMISTPLMLGDDLPGGLNLYRGGASAIEAVEVQLSSAFASQATAVVLNARAYMAAAELAHNLLVALKTRDRIERAKGILIATLGITADEAFTELRKRSQRESLLIEQIAAHIVGEADARPEV